MIWNVGHLCQLTFANNCSKHFSFSSAMPLHLKNRAYSSGDWVTTLSREKDGFRKKNECRIATGQTRDSLGAQQMAKNKRMNTSRNDKGHLARLKLMLEMWSTISTVSRPIKQSRPLRSQTPTP